MLVLPGTVLLAALPLPVHVFASHAPRNRETRDNEEFADGCDCPGAFNLPHEHRKPVTSSLGLRRCPEQPVVLEYRTYVTGIAGCAGSPLALILSPDPQKL